MHSGPEEYTKRSASLFWPKVKPAIDIRLPLNDLKSFRFDGTLQSKLLDGATINHEFYDTETKTPLSAADFTAAGGGPFTLKASCHMKDKLWSSLSISIFPKQLEELVAKFPYADDSNFPGLNLLTVDVKLMPNAHEEYGLAFMPLLQKGDKESSFPPGVSYAVRSSIAALLQTGRAPKFARDITSLQNKWTKLEGLGDKGRDSLMMPSSPAKQWPSALPSPALDLDNMEHKGM